MAPRPIVRQPNLVFLRRVWDVGAKVTCAEWGVEFAGCGVSVEYLNSNGKKSSGGASVSKKGLLSYTTITDYVLIVVGFLAAVGHGAGFPLLSIVLGGMTTVFLRAQNSEFVTGHPFEWDNSSGIWPISKEDFDASVGTYCMYYLLIGIFMFVSSYIQIACWESFAERTTQRIRKNYLEAILRQQIGWFDTQQTGNLTARLTECLIIIYCCCLYYILLIISIKYHYYIIYILICVLCVNCSDLERVREGVGDKLSLMIQLVCAFIAGFVVGFVYEWRMTLVMTAFAPLSALTGAWMSRMASSRTKVEQEKYAVAGAIAEETFSSIRTVHSLNGASFEIYRFEKALEDGRKTGRLKYLYMGIGMGLSYLVMYTSYAVAFWYGSVLIVGDPTFDRGAVFTVFFSVMSGSMALGGALPHMATFAMARGASHKVLSIINNIPLIDPYSNAGIFPSKLKGNISIQNVSFSYPIRKDIQILDRISLDVPSGSRIALVGASGCGKSTIINLLLRFYDPDLGMICLDGYDLRSLNVRRLRDSIGIVSQEPVLFDGTLESNILLGRDEATRDDIIKACKLANAWDFIQMLPDGLDTRVGERGVQLSGAFFIIICIRILLCTLFAGQNASIVVYYLLVSLLGGQKQRIAIARALIKNPKILLLDEATSALDTESEACVQKALEQAQKGRTTITIAHRLSTIRDSDVIYVFKNGRIVEKGKHLELCQSEGLYYGMVMAQSINQHKDGPKEEDGKEEAEPASDEGAEPAKSPPTSSVSRDSKMIRRKASSFYQSKSGRSSALQIMELQQEAEESALAPTPLKKILLVNRENWPYLSIGLLGCCMSGLVPPFFALVYSQIFNVFSEPLDQLGRDARFWSLMFVICGVVNASGFFISANMLGLCGEALTKKIRLRAFINLLRQGIDFYDDQRHSTGKLCTRFATDAPNVRYVFTRLPLVVASVVTLLGAIAIGFVFGWQLALILLAIIPLILGSGYVEMKLQFGKQLRETQLLEEAGKTATEAVENIRTVQALNKQSTFIATYSEHLQTPFRENMRRAHIYGAVFAFSQSLIFFMYALAFWLGSIFVDSGYMQPINVYRLDISIGILMGIFGIIDVGNWVFFAIAFCGQSVGHISAFIPDVVKARLAASLIFHLSEYPTKIDSLSDEGIDKASAKMVPASAVVVSAASGWGLRCGVFIDIMFRRYFIGVMPVAGFGLCRLGYTSDILLVQLRLVHEVIKGKISLKNVHFSYPTRRRQKILKGISLNVRDGETLALVGHSGCGKSTIMALLERFYDVNRGDIYVDGENIRDVNIKSLRNQICIVSQEPVLFDCTIEENILYGLSTPDNNIIDNNVYKNDNNNKLTHENVVAAAKLANIHQFILSLPLGYETRVGEKGTQLSGGQKQRLAIARALIRNPAVLLLDEATSALDTESEQVVQEALENARKGRTCLVIAHRLSTVQNADSIAVLDNGRIVEKGEFCFHFTQK
ncbi:unnamed protein product [Anisakis simplex]|uniref:ABC transporter PGP-2 (inferred by orthology to a C. elegans protein) n=1 Tax=Anisakis simplex TaxID=6269 RepID=A0A0M3JVF6_ANISI|nr:unnamed protein product [Anisakis simplex]